MLYALCYQQHKCQEIWEKLQKLLESYIPTLTIKRLSYKKLDTFVMTFNEIENFHIKERFFVFTPLKTIKKFGSFYGRVDKPIKIDLNNDYNILELDGDIVTIYDRYLDISHLRDIKIAL